MNIKIKLLELGKRQVDLIFELKRRHYKVQPCEMSNIISGAMTTPKADVIKREVAKIIEEWEAERKMTRKE